MRPPSNRVAAYGLRPSDDERDEAISELRNRFAEGRLSQETFLYRMDVALRAKDQAELSHLFVDLPASEVRPRGIWRLFGAGGASRGLVGGRLAWPRRASRGMAWSRMLDGHLRPVQDAVPADSVGFAVVPTRPQPLCLPRQEDGKFTIGRAPSCDFTVGDLSVSRWHARLHKEEETWMLSDLGSTNGTRLNGWRVTSGVQVRPGDQVSFGSATYVITSGPAA